MVSKRNRNQMQFEKMQLQICNKSIDYDNQSIAYYNWSLTQTKNKMKINYKSIAYAITFISLLSFTSCNKDNDNSGLDKPEIKSLEIGMNDNHIGTIGGDLHLEAHITAEAKIEKIEVELHAEDGSGDEIETEFLNFKGQKNATFHEHIEIPASTTAGEYHFHFKVIDQEGQTSSMEADVEIK